MPNSNIKRYEANTVQNPLVYKAYENIKANTDEQSVVLSEYHLRYHYTNLATIMVSI